MSGSLQYRGPDTQAIFGTNFAMNIVHAQAAQSYPVLLITLYLYINSILKIIRKSCVINLLRLKVSLF